MDHAVPAVIEHFGLLAVFILSLLESACVPIPSELVVPLAGFLAYQGHMSLTGASAAATLGNVAGSWLAYAVGYYGGRPFISRYGRYVWLNERHLARIERWFARHGDITVFATRLLPAFRTFVSLPAGVARMPPIRFTIYSLAGALPWNLALALAGYQLGAHWLDVAEYLKPLSYVGAVLLVLTALWFWFGQRR